MNSTLIQLVELVACHADAHTMARKALPQIVGYLGADNGSLMLLAGDQVIHKVLANKDTFSEVSEHKVRTVLAEGLAGWSLRRQQGALASDTALDDRWVSMGDTSIASAMVVPMISRNSVMGVLSFHHGERRHFRESHLAQAAELAQLIAPLFDIALMAESSMTALTAMCQRADAPSVVLTWQGDVKMVNPAMEALDIVWEGGHFAQSLLPRELGLETIPECDWDGARKLVQLPYAAYAVSLRGVGVWIQLIPSS